MKEEILLSKNPPSEIKAGDVLKVIMRYGAYTMKALVERDEVCAWTERLSDWDGSTEWNTNCRNDWQFDDGNPEENHMLFCPFCGRSLKQVLYDSADED